MDKEHFERELASKEVGSRPFRGASEFSTNYGSNTLTVGAREFGVDEPPLASNFELTPFRLVLPIFFDEIAEPRELSRSDLVAVVKSCGGSVIHDGVPLLKRRTVI
jgi:hypothetical protein